MSRVAASLLNEDIIMPTSQFIRSSNGVHSIVIYAIVFATTTYTAPTAFSQFTMSIPTDLTAHPGDTITIPVLLSITGNQLDSDHGMGIGAASFVIGCSTSLSSGIGSFTLGSLISNPTYGFSNYTTNNTPGLIRAITSSTAGTPGLDSGTSGSLALISFTVSPSVAPGDYTLNLLSSSGSTTSSFVDNNFNTYDTTSGLILASGSISVTPVPEPNIVLQMVMASFGFVLLLRRNGLLCSFERQRD